ITLGTPHNGTYTTNWMPTSLSQQMAPDSPLIRQLNRQQPEGVRCATMSAGADLLVLPPTSAQTQFGQNYHFEDLGHTEMLLSLRVMRAVHQFLQDSEVH
ncbi:MAG: hypothetical protein HN348_33820, partial [Proteobacteria bacterium]|nr:hypothetical protein [Pseudomonadota bacterium]